MEIVIFAYSFTLKERRGALDVVSSSKNWLIFLCLLEISLLCTKEVFCLKCTLAPCFAPSVSLVNKALVDYYFVELNVEKHFEALRHFLLMEDGEFAQSLSDLLFEKVLADAVLDY